MRIDLMQFELRSIWRDRSGRTFVLCKIDHVQDRLTLHGDGREFNVTPEQLRALYVEIDDDDEIEQFHAVKFNEVKPDIPPALKYVQPNGVSQFYKRGKSRTY